MSKIVYTCYHVHRGGRDQALIKYTVILLCLCTVFIIPCFGQTNYALKFDGVDDYVSIPSSSSLNPTAAVSLEAWIYLEDATAYQQGIAGTWDDMQGSYRTYHMWIEGGKGDWHVGRGGPWSHAKDSANFPVKKWTHIAGTYNGSVITLYIDGVLRITGNFPGPIGTNAFPFYIGRNYSGSNGIDYFNGMIDDVRLWNRELTQAEIQSRMYSKLTGTETGLLAYWPFDEGSGTSTADLTSNGNNGMLVNQVTWVLSGVTPPSPPAAPSNLTTNVLCATRVELNWVDNSSNETNFTIEQQVNGGPWVVVATTLYDATTCIVTNVQPQSTVSFRVKAVNSYSPSAYSNIAQSNTGLFNTPTNLVANSLGFNSIHLQWNDNSICESGFIIERMITTNNWNPIDTVREGITETTINNLQANTQYDFRVKAYDGTIHSAYSNTVSVRTKKFLPSPTDLNANVLSATQAQLLWVDNASDETGYEIEQRSPGGSWLHVSTTSANETTYTRNGLTPDSTYYFRVRAVGVDASSDWTNERMVIMVFRPEPPRTLSANAIDYRSIALLWTRGSWNETSYEIERREGGGGWVTVMITGRGDTTATDEGLTDLTTYTYRVRAMNNAGISDWSNEASARTDSIPRPGSPFGLIANAMGPTVIRLTWFAPEPSVESGFEIEVSLSGNVGSFSKITPDAQSGARNYNHQSLTPQTMYWYRIRAFNKSGYSSYSQIVSARTLAATKDPPLAPFNLTAEGLSLSEIRLTWSVSDSTYVENFELERSLTGNPSDFSIITPNPIGSDRVRIDTGLTENTIYYYRMRAVNSNGSSGWSNIASGKTRDLPVTPALRAAMNAKDTLIGLLEKLIPDGNADMVALRQLFGDYPRGYDETPAKNLIQDLYRTGATEPTKTTEAMRRYTLAEQVLMDVYATDPTFPGAKEMAREAMQAPSLCAKDMGALVLLWKDERAKIPIAWLSRYDAVMDDLTFSMLDGERTLSSLVGMSSGCTSLYSEAVNNHGDVQILASRRLPLMTSYYQERFLGNAYFPATQFIIDDYAQYVRNPVVIGSYDSAVMKVMRHIDEVKARTIALKSEFTQYGNALTDLDAAFVISSSGNTDLGPFLRKMMLLRPRLLDNTQKAIVGSSIPIKRAAYLTSSSSIPSIGSLPFEVRSSANVAFDPVTNNLTGEGNIFQSLLKEHIPNRAVNQTVIDTDRAALLALRAKVLENDTAYIGLKFDELRISGRRALEELSRGMRPIEGITPLSFISDTTLMYTCLDAIAKTHRARTLRTVLSAALADYLTDASDTKNAPLVAEIDTILGYYDSAANALADILPVTTNIITEPVLSMQQATLHQIDPSDPLNYRVNFIIKNVGGNEAKGTQARLTMLTPGVVPTTADTFSIGTLSKKDVYSDSIAIHIPRGTTSITIVGVMTVEGNRTFDDHVTLVLPTPTQTGRGEEDRSPAIVFLHQNYPNPLSLSDRSSTTINYSLKEKCSVVLKVFNVLGMEVATLVNETKSAGMYSALFNAQHLESGVYTYTLLVNGQRLHRQMIIVK